MPLCGALLSAPDRIRTCDLRFRRPIRPSRGIRPYRAISDEIALLTAGFHVYRSAPLDTPFDPLSPFSEGRSRGANVRLNGEKTSPKAGRELIAATARRHSPQATNVRRHPNGSFARAGPPHGFASFNSTLPIIDVEHGRFGLLQEPLDRPHKA
jgi:hypothetical protein